MQSVFSVFHESKLCGSSATFYGKVSFPPLCPHWLPDTGRALCECVCGEQTLLITESGAGREEGLRSSQSFYGRGGQLLKLSSYCVD